MLKSTLNLFIFALVIAGLLLAGQEFVPQLSIAKYNKNCVWVLTFICFVSLINLNRNKHIKSEKLVWQFFLFAFTSNILLALLPTAEFAIKTQFLLQDYRYLLFYLLILMALEVQPNKGLVPITKMAIGIIPRGVFILVCFSYFIILPANFSPDIYITKIPSHYFYVIVNALLIVQLIYNLQYAANSYWRHIYLGLTISAVFLLIHHSLIFIPTDKLNLRFQSVFLMFSLLLFLATSLIGKTNTEKNLNIKQHTVFPLYTILFLVLLPLIHLFATHFDLIFIVNNIGQTLLISTLLVFAFVYFFRLIKIQQTHYHKMNLRFKHQQEVNSHLISEIEALTDEITYSEERAIVGVSNNAILTCNTQGKILSANPAAVKLFQRLEDELIHCNSNELFVEHDEMRQFFNFESNLHSLQRHERGISKECLALRSDQHQFPVQAELQWAQRAEQPLVVLTFIDLTSRKLAEQKNLESKDNFIANISHELRTPLTIINGIIDHQLGTTTNNQEIVDLTTAKRNGLRLVRMVEQLLELSRLADTPPLEKITYPLASLMKMPLSSFSRLAKQNGVTFDYKLPAELWIECDAQGFEKILFNLLANAIKYTPSGGQVKVEIVKKYSEIFINIIDSGIGINSDMHDKIFQRFQRADEVMNKSTFGVGIGLSLVNELVKIHGWRLNLASKEGKGSRFTLVIPAIQEPKNQLAIPPGMSEQEVSSLIIPQTPHLSKSKNHSQHMVLVIEDNIDMQSHIKRVIEQQHHCIIADSAETGIELALATIPDIIVCDLMLPGIDGFAALTALKENELTCHIPVVLLTARGDLDSRISGFELKADEYLSKPFNQQELLVRINSLIDNRMKLKSIHLANALKDQQQNTKIATLNKAIDLTSHDTPKTTQTDKFLIKLAEITSKKYAQMDFDIQLLAKELAVSERQLQRKVKMLLDISPNNYIKEFRLVKAKERLLKGEQVGQVALAVGFSSQTYFGRCFKEVYHCTPKQYQKEH